VNNNEGFLLKIRFWFILLVILFMVMIFEFTLNGPFLGSDDVYIHLRYIDNLRSGHGFGFNPNSPSYGSTSPLWVIIASYITRTAQDLPFAVKVFSVSIFLLSIVGFFFVSYQLTRSLFFALLCTMIFASDPWLLKWGGSAMEASLPTLMVVLVTAFILRSDLISNMILTSFILGIATLVRPEFLLFSLIFVLLQFVAIANLREKLARLTLAVIIYIMVLIPWLVFSFNNFGTLIPNTFFAKTLYSSNAIRSVALYFIGIMGLSYWWALLVIAIGLPVLLVRIIRQHLRLRWGYRQYARASLWLWIVALPVYYVLSRLQTPSTRYLQITTPILILVSFSLLAQLLGQRLRNLSPEIPFRLGEEELTHKFIFQRLSGSRTLSNILLLMTIGIVIFNILLNALVVLPSSYEFSEGTLQTYQKVGEWLRANTSPDEAIAVAIDVGAIGYFSNRQIIDLGGLNSAEVLEYLPNANGYVLVSQPNFLVITGEMPQYSLLHDPIFSAIASPIYSLPLDSGRRADLQQFVKVRPKMSQYVSIYRLNW
jgi:hypothetical protein